MRMWQPLLELLLHHAPIAVLLYWSFCLGRLGGLSLGVCCFLLPWPWLAEDRMVLGNDSQQLGPSLLILRRFFFLGVGLGLDTKWFRLAKSFAPQLYIIYYKYNELPSPSQFVCPLFHFVMSWNIVLFLKIKVINLLIFLLYPYLIFKTIWKEN